MDEEEVLKILEASGAVLTAGHFVYTSGKHGSAYINKDAVYPHTDQISKLCREIARRFASSPVEVVIAPVIGGVILSQWVASHLSELKGREVLAVYAEKGGEEFLIRRGYDRLVRGKKVLVVEDILNTGGSVKKVVDATRAAGGDVLAVAALCNRGAVGSTDVGGIPEIFSLVNLSLEAWDPASCPLCQKGVPVNREVGKGKELQKANP